MGKPSWGHAQLPAPEYIGRVEGTSGSETSQYRQEEKANSDSVSSGERTRITGQTNIARYPAGVAVLGLRDQMECAAVHSKSKKFAI